MLPVKRQLLLVMLLLFIQQAPSGAAPGGAAPGNYATPSDGANSSGGASPSGDTPREATLVAPPPSGATP